ncbi:hypothetical protein TorRG33x02_278310, partial [Trema orientale]
MSWQAPIYLARTHWTRLEVLTHHSSFAYKVKPSNAMKTLHQLAQEAKLSYKSLTSQQCSR